MTNPRAELKPSDRAIAQAFAIESECRELYDERASKFILHVLGRARALDAAQPAGEAVARELTCEDCDTPYGTDGWCDVVIPDAIWNSLGAGLLCFRCMTKRLQAAGYGPENPVPVIVASGPYKDANEEWRLIGWEHGHKVAPQAVAGAVPDGFAIVPKEPTDAMLAAAFDADCKAQGFATGNDARRAIYLAMLASAPQPPDADKGEAR